jgi:probable rRNA maturation factor
MPPTNSKNPGDSRGGARFAIDLRVSDPAWRVALPGAATLVRRAAQSALKQELPRGRSGLALLLTNDAEMRRLNGDWRGKRKPTNVLSFPAEDAVDPASPPPYLGDVALGLEICVAEAKAQKKPLADHVAHLVVHGTLHLLGYDHESDEQAAAMEPCEVAILAGMKIADPYAPPKRGGKKPPARGIKKQAARSGKKKP